MKIAFRKNMCGGEKKYKKNMKLYLISIILIIIYFYLK
jgi:hypothetical protein